MSDNKIPNLWEGVPFHAGDTVLLEWTDDEDAIGRAVWVVPNSCVVEDPDYAEMSMADDGEGLLINGSENIYPSKLTVLQPGENPISVDGYQEVSLKDFQVGDSLIIVMNSDENITVEHVLNSESIRGQQNGQLYSVLGIAFSSYDEATFFRKVAS